MEITIYTIKSITNNNCKIIGNSNLIFKGMQSVQEAESDDITWIKPSVAQAGEFINSTKSGGIICDIKTFELFTGNTNDKLFIVSEDPKFVFVSFVKYISNKLSNKKESFIHPTAIIDPSCTIGKNVSIGAYSIIGACTIGDNSNIHQHVKIYDRVTLGKNCMIREFCSIGGAGFGYLKDADGKNEHIPHIGSVFIEDNVEIYPYSNVDRGTLGKTIIKRGTVIDHYVHIGHNTTTGKNNIIAAGVVLAGGSSIKDNCFIGVKTILKEKCTIGSNVITGMGAVVVKNIPDNEIWVGNPAKFLKPNN